MPHKTARLLGLCLVALSLLALHRAAARPPAPLDHGSVFRVNWGVSLPPPSKELYFAESPRDFHGGGSRLLVYTDDSGAVPRDMRRPDAHVRRTAAFILASLDDVPAAHIPPLEQPFYFRLLERGAGQLLFLAYPSQHRMYLLESSG